MSYRFGFAWRIGVAPVEHCVHASLLLRQIVNLPILEPPQNMSFTTPLRRLKGVFRAVYLLAVTLFCRFTLALVLAILLNCLTINKPE